MAGVALLQVARNWANAVLSLVYPEWCQICDKHPARPEHGFVCDACRQTVKRVQTPLCELCGRPFQGQISNAFSCSQCKETPPSYVFARSAALTDGVVLQAICKYKYNGALYIEPFLAGLLVESARGALTPGHWDIIVPVPLHWKKRRQREFNQADRLAKHLAKAIGIPLGRRILRRISATRTQTRLTREERFENVRGAFQVRRPGSARGLRCVVVDDVFTTGATTNACAEALLHDGAARVCVWTVARGN